jgi:hypothetical protein
MVEASDGTYPDKVRVTWVVVIGATSYNVWWSDSVAGMMWFLGSTSGTTYDHTYSSPGPGVLQYYWVTACNGPRCSTFSDGDSGYRGCDPPAAPAGLQATDDRLPDRVALSWSAVAGADSYEVYRAASPEGARFWLGEVTATAYDDTSAVPGTPYHYWVTACDSCGCGDYSNSDTGSRSGTCTDPPSPPGNVQASDGTYAEKVQVSWDPVAGAENYEIFRAGSANGVRRLLGFATGKSYGDTTAIPGPTYYYWVRTCTHACGCGDLGSHDTGYRPAVSAERIYLPLLVR